VPAISFQVLQAAGREHRRDRPGDQGRRRGAAEGPAAGRRAAPGLRRQRLGRALARRRQAHLIEGALLTIAIVFLFLHSWRSTVITGLTLPIAVISAFIAVYLFGFTLNFMTMMALSLCIGLLIDDAIVVRGEHRPPRPHGQGPSRGGAASAPRRSAWR
jgi:hypothetical protein